MVILLENLNFPAIFDIWKTSIWISRNFLYLGKSNLNCPAFFVKRKKVRENQISPFSYILCALESTYYLSLIAFYKQISYFTLADSGQAKSLCVRRMRWSVFCCLKKGFESPFLPCRSFRYFWVKSKLEKSHGMLKRKCNYFPSRLARQD